MGWREGGNRSTLQKKHALWAPPERRAIFWPTKTALWRRAPGKQPACAWGMHRPRRWGAGEDTARAFCNVLRAPEGATRAIPPWHAGGERWSSAVTCGHLTPQNVPPALTFIQCSHHSVVIAMVSSKHPPTHIPA